MDKGGKGEEVRGREGKEGRGRKSGGEVIKRGRDRKENKERRGTIKGEGGIGRGR